MANYESDPTAATLSFYALDPVVAIDEADIRDLGRLAVSAQGPARFNLHSSRGDDLHCMAILQPARVYSQPRLHRSKAKVFQMLRGEMIVVAFGDEGDVISLYRMGLGQTLIVRIAPGIFHTNFALSDQAAYHEVITGPYEPETDDRVYASFAPDGDDQEAGRDWITRVIEREQPELLLGWDVPGLE